MTLRLLPRLVEEEVGYAGSTRVRRRRRMIHSMRICGRSGEQEARSEINLAMAALACANGCVGAGAVARWRVC